MRLPYRRGLRITVKEANGERWFMKTLLFQQQPLHLEKLRIALTRIGYGKNRDMNFHEHKFSEAAIILSSTDTVHWADGRSAPLMRGDVILMHPGSVHAYEHTGHLALVNLIYNADQLPLPHLDGGELRRFCFFLDPTCREASPEKPIVHLDEKTLSSVESLMVQLEHELNGNAPGKHLCAFGLFVAILVRLCRAGGRASQSEYVSAAVPALHYLNLHCRENVSVDQLARLCCLSRTHFFRRFRELAGCSPREYQRQKRLELAESLLRTTGERLDYIAYYCGFCDSNHLIRHFSRRYGISPGVFRKTKEP